MIFFVKREIGRTMVLLIKEISPTLPPMYCLNKKRKKYLINSEIRSAKKLLCNHDNSPTHASIVVAARIHGNTFELLHHPLIHPT